MAIKHVDLSLFDVPDYEYTVALEGSYFTIRIIYNEVAKLYTLNISDANKIPLVFGTALVPNYPILGDYQVEGLTGYFVLLVNTEQDKEFYKLYPTQLNQYYTFHYVYDDTTQ